MIKRFRNSPCATLLILGALCAPATAAAQKLEPDFYDQLGSGLKVIRIVNSNEQIAVAILVKNVSSSRIVGFEVACTLGNDERLDPGTPAQPEWLAGRKYVSREIEPGKTAEVSDVGPKIKDAFQRLTKRGLKVGLLRVGVTKVTYADGREQNFDLLKDEQSRRSSPAPDTGGISTLHGQQRQAAVRQVAAKSEARPQPACNWQACNIQCLDYPTCGTWVFVCEPSPRYCTQG